MKKVLFLLTLLMLITSCGKTGKTVELYYLNNEGTLQAENMNVDSDYSIEEVCRLLFEGPHSADLKRVIPQDTKILDITQDGDLVVVNLSHEFENGNTSTKLWSRYSIVYTLCSLENVERVELRVEGEQLISLANGETLQPLGKQDVVLATQANGEPSNVTLYYAKNDGTGLASEDVSITLYDGQTLEKAVATKLLGEPESKDLMRTIPIGTRLLSIETKEKICFVNFSREMISKHTGGTSTELLTLYSIVNSLCKLPTVDKVQILIEGKKEKIFINTEIEKPLLPDYDI